MLRTARRISVHVRHAFLSVPKILRKGRRAGAKEFCILQATFIWSWDCCVQDIGEFNEMYGPLCWQGCDREHGGLKKLMWYGIMKEFNCKVTSKWSNCGREKEMDFTHQQYVEKGKGRKAQLDYIVGPRWKSDEACINNDVKIWDSWDHYPDLCCDTAV